MVRVTFPMSITGTVITPPGTVGTGTPTSIASGAEVIAADIKAGTEEAVKEAVEADVPGVAAVVEAVKVASAVVIKIVYSNKRIYKGTPKKGAFFYTFRNVSPGKWYSVKIIF